MKEQMERDIREAIKWMESHTTHEDDEVKYCLSRLINWIHVLQLQQKQERRLWEL